MWVEMMTRRRGLAGFESSSSSSLMPGTSETAFPTARRLGGDVLDGGNEVGETFADAGAGFDDEVLAKGERPLDRVGHRELLRAMLVGGEPGGDAAGGAEDGRS